MNKFIIPSVLCLSVSASYSWSDGIEQTNYNASLRGQYGDVGNIYGLGAQVRVPLSSHYGAMASIQASEFSAENNAADASDTLFSVGLLGRWSDWGEVVLGYSSQNANSESPDNVLSIDTDTRSLSFSATAYAGQFDFSASLAKVDITAESTFNVNAFGPVIIDSDFDSNFIANLTQEEINAFLGQDVVIAGDFDTEQEVNLEVAEISAAYYLSDNFSLRYSLGLLDAENSNSLQFLYQPPGFDNRVALSAGYFDSDNQESYGFRITYFFNASVNLLERNRSY